MIARFSAFVLFFFFLSCQGQKGGASPATQLNPYSTAPHLYGQPPVISSTDTSPGWRQNGQKILITGTVWQPDGKTPAPNIIIYYYQTNTEGRYLHQPGEARSLPPNGEGQTHGYIRGWVKTDSNGCYAIYTVRPGSYPGGDNPAHIHPTIQEPGKEAYYIDDFVFDDDKLLTTALRRKMENRGGSGVLRMARQGNLLIGERNIVLGLNIPDYPGAKTEAFSSGGKIGEDLFSFIPYHAWGPDKGTRTCPICKYGWYQGILYFVGNRPNWTEIRQWLLFLERESIKREKYLKVYFVYGNEEVYSKEGREQLLAGIGEELKLKKLALSFVPSWSDRDSEIYLNRINPLAENTFILYKRNTIIDQLTNLRPNQASFDLITKRLDESVNAYFYLPEQKHE